MEKFSIDLVILIINISFALSKLKQGIDKNKFLWSKFEK